MYSFFLDGTQLPVTPQKLTVKIKGGNKTLTLVNESDVNFLRLPGLTEDATKGPDVTVAVTLKQYKSFATKTVQVQKTETATTVKTETPRETSSAPSVKTYTVKSGDCLWNIAKKYYGNGARYSDIYNANKDKISNPNLIYPGQVLTIP